MGTSRTNISITGHMSRNGGTNQLATLLKVPLGGLLVHLGGRVDPTSFVKETLIGCRLKVVLAVSADLEQLVVRRGSPDFGMLTGPSFLFRVVFEKQSLPFSFVHWEHSNVSWTLGLWMTTWLWLKLFLAASRYLFWCPRPILTTGG
jgi:hypothetical protein